MKNLPTSFEDISAVSSGLIEIKSICSFISIVGVTNTLLIVSTTKYKYKNSKWHILSKYSNFSSDPSSVILFIIYFFLFWKVKNKLCNYKNYAIYNLSQELTKNIILVKL